MASHAARRLVYVIRSWAPDRLKDFWRIDLGCDRDIVAAIAFARRGVLIAFTPIRTIPLCQAHVRRFAGRSGKWSPRLRSTRATPTCLRSEQRRPSDQRFPAVQQARCSGRDNACITLQRYETARRSSFVSDFMAPPNLRDMHYRDFVELSTIRHIFASLIHASVAPVKPCPQCWPGAPRPPSKVKPPITAAGYLRGWVSSGWGKQ